MIYFKKLPERSGSFCVDGENVTTSRDRARRLHLRIGFLRGFCCGSCENEGGEGEEEGEDVDGVERGFEEGVDGEDEEGKTGGEREWV